MSLSYVSDDAAEVGKRKSKAERKAEREKKRAGRKERRARTGSRVGKIALAPARAAFLGLVSMNAFKTATKLSQAWKTNKAKVIKFWVKFSGKENALKEAIEKGSKQQLGVVTAAAALATATPILIALAALYKELKMPEDEDLQDGIDDGLEEIENNPEFEKGDTKEYVPPGKVAVVPGGTKPKSDDTPTPEKSNTGLILVGLLAAYALTR